MNLRRVRVFGGACQCFFFYRDIWFYRVFLQIGTKENPVFFSLPDIYHAKNRDKTGETESQKKGIFLAISLSVDRRESLGIRSTLIPLGPSALGPWPTPLPALMTLFFPDFFRKSAQKKPVFFTLSIFTRFSEKTHRDIFTMQKKEHGTRCRQFADMYSITSISGAGGLLRALLGF